MSHSRGSIHTSEALPRNTRACGWMRAILCLWLAGTGVTCTKGPAERIQWVLIQPGSFTPTPSKHPYMTPQGPDGKPVVEKAFELSAFEITRAQWREVMTGQRYDGNDGNKPMTRIRYHEALLFCEKLSETDGRTYRLPRWNEWEHACRAGAATRYAWGDDFDEAFAWSYESSGGEVHDVGTKKPNAWGLYDMEGNAGEFILARTKPVRWPFSMGGSAAMRGENCGCSSSRLTAVAERWPDAGFRVVRELDDD